MPQHGAVLREIEPTPASLLVVESDIVIRHPLAEYLRECGYRVLEAMNADEAIRLLEETANPVEAVLANTREEQQAEDRFRLASWIRAHRPRVEVMLVGSLTKVVEKASDLCAQGPAETKPADHQYLLEEIRRALASRDRNKRR